MFIKRKLMVAVLAVAMIVTFMPSMAFAADGPSNAKEVSVNSVEELRAEIEQVRGTNTHLTIKLNNDITGFVRVLGKIKRNEQGEPLDKDGNVTNDKAAYVIDSTKVTLDLNGHKITGGQVDSAGKLKLKPTISVGAHADVTVKGKGDVIAPDVEVIEDYGDGDTYTYHERKNCIKNKGTLTIEDGNYKSIDYETINNYGTLTINGGSFQSTSDDVIYNRGTATINGGKFFALDNEHAIYNVSNEKSAALTINGGTFEAEYLLYNDNWQDYPNSVVINDGDFSETEHIAYDYDGDLNPNLDTIVIKGGEFSDEEEAELAAIDKAVSERPAQLTEADRTKAIAAAIAELRASYKAEDYGEFQLEDIQWEISRAEKEMTESCRTQKTIDEEKAYRLKNIAEVETKADKAAAKKQIEDKYNSYGFSNVDKEDQEIDSYIYGYDAGDEGDKYHENGVLDDIDEYNYSKSDLTRTVKRTLRYLDNYVTNAEKTAANTRLSDAYKALKQADFDEDIWNQIQTEAQDPSYLIDSINYYVDEDTTDGWYYYGPDKKKFNSEVDKLVARVGKFPTKMTTLNTARTSAKNAVTQAFQTYKKDDFTDSEWEEMQGYAATDEFDDLYNLDDIDKLKTEKLQGMKYCNEWSDKNADVRWYQEEADDFAKKVNSIPDKPTIAYSARVATLIYQYDNSLSNDVKKLLDPAVKKKLDNARKYIDDALLKKVALSQKKIDAKKALQDSYKLTDYRAAQQTAVKTVVDNATKAIDIARTSAAVNRALSNAKAAIAKIKTNAQLTQEENANKAQEAKKAEQKAKSITKPAFATKAVTAASLAKALARKGGKPKYVKSITLGAGVTKIAPKSFVKFNNLTTLVISSKKLTKNSVKNSLKGSKITTVKIKVTGSKKEKKKLLKKYKKFFTKKNCGKKVKVTL